MIEVNPPPKGRGFLGGKYTIIGQIYFRVYTSMILLKSLKVKLNYALVYRYIYPYTIYPYHPYNLNLTILTSIFTIFTILTSIFNFKWKEFFCRKNNRNQKNNRNYIETNRNYETMNKNYDLRRE